MPNQGLSTRSRLLFKWLVALTYLGALALDGWILLVRAQGTWDARVALALQMLALYTFAFGFLAQTGLLKHFGQISEGMTSPNLYQYLRGNFLFLGILFLSLSVAIQPRKTAYSPLYLLEIPVLMVAALVMLMYAAFHLVVIAPIAYIAYAIVSIPIRNIQTSAGDQAISDGEQTVTIREIVSANVVSVRSFLVAIPALVLSLILKTASILG